MRVNGWTLAALIAVPVAGAAALWLFQGLAPGPQAGFVLQLRALRLAALLLVAAAVAVATVLLQSVAQNRVLTPSLLGFDALYLLIQTLAVAGLGIAGAAAVPPGPKFVAEAGAMTLLSVVLYGALLGRADGAGIGRTILTGVVMGILFRSGAGLAGRMADPDAYAVIQAASFANFSRPAPGTLGLAAAVVLPALALAMALGPRLDLMALGRDRAVSLGLRHRAMVLGTLALVALLTAAATALVGPVAFLGLIVVALAHLLVPGAPHRVLLPVATAIAAVLLIAGQWAFERVLGLAATLSVAIEFCGGILFLALVLKGRLR